MTKAYAAFKDKGFEIYSISIDANKDDQKKSVEKNNVTDSKGLYSIMVAKYGVRAIPKIFFINPDGIIEAIDCEIIEIKKANQALRLKVN